MRNPVSVEVSAGLATGWTCHCGAGPVSGGRVVSTFPILWSFSSEISEEELDTSFLDGHGAPDRLHILDLLRENPHLVILRETAHEEAVRDYLRNVFLHEDDDSTARLGSLLSRPMVGDDYFIETFVGERWPVPDNCSADVFLHRYVTLLSCVVGSTPWADEGWPHGRWSLTEVDGNFGAKALGGVEHQAVPPLESDDFDPFRMRLLIDNLVEFGSLLSNFSDRIGGSTWNSWLTTIDRVRRAVGPTLFGRRLERGAGHVIEAYFTLRQENGEFLEYPELVGEIPVDSAFWDCLEYSIERAVPPWSRRCSEGGRRLAGLVIGALDDDGFARHFTTIDRGYRPLVMCTFDTWRAALRLDEEEMDSAFREIDVLRTRHDLPFDFNT